MNAAAVRQLTHSGKRPFVSAVCRHLGVWPPARSRSRPRVSAVAEKQLAIIHRVLAQRRPTNFNVQRPTVVSQLLIVFRHSDFRGRE
jgi:hypothetical protein